MCTVCDSTDINTIIEFVPHVSSDGFNGGSDSYLHFWDTHAPCLLKLCIPPSNGIVRWWLFPEFGAELRLDICTPTIILNNPVFCTYFNYSIKNSSVLFCYSSRRFKFVMTTLSLCLCSTPHLCMEDVEIKFHAT